MRGCWPGLEKSTEGWSAGAEEGAEQRPWARGGGARQMPERTRTGRRNTRVELQFSCKDVNVQGGFFKTKIVNASEGYFGTEGLFLLGF
jgi:hypothetical protein